MPPIYNPDTNTSLHELVLLILVIAIPLAFLASMAILSIYRRAVLRTMRTRANTGMSEPTPTEAEVFAQNTVQLPLHISILDSGSGKTNGATAAGLHADLLHGPWRVAAIYAVAGLAYALVTTLIFLRATKTGFHPLSFLIIFWYYAWPVPVTVSLIAATTWSTRLKIFGSYFLIIVVLGVIALLGNSATSWLEIIGLWLLTNLPATFVLLTFLNRRIQAVGPLVLTFMILAVTGLVLLPTFVINNGWLLYLVASIGVALGLDGIGIYIALLILGFITFGAIGWIALQVIGSWYRRKRISEQSITIDAIWLLFGIFQAIGLIFEGDHWFLASLFSFAIYKIVAWVGFKFVGRNTPSNQKYPNLLVLRVFSLGKRSERLFDALAMHWRFAGSIQLIAGPDLATSTMEPHEFLDFLSGKLARRFIDNIQTLDRRISEMDRLPDPDGQFRVNDFFCYEDTWRMVLSRIVRESDAVMMDLRGFSSQNTGCIFEISELINMTSLEQVVFIIDDSTNEAFLRQVLQQSWEQMSPASPNRLLASGTLSLFRVNQLGTMELQNLLYVLSRAARSTAETQALARSLASDARSS